VARRQGGAGRRGCRPWPRARRHRRLGQGGEPRALGRLELGQPRALGRVELGQRRDPDRLERRAVEDPLELGETGPELVALLVDLLAEGIEVATQRVARVDEVFELGLGGLPGALGAPPGLGLDLRPHPGGLFPSLAQEPRRLVLRFLDRGVGRALGQHQCAPQRVVGLAHLGSGRTPLCLSQLALHVAQPTLRALGPGHGIAQAIVEQRHTLGDPLEEVVDVSGVVAAPPGLTELDSVKRLWSQFHDKRVARFNTTPLNSPQQAVASAEHPQQDRTKHEHHDRG
jgi:hypothetical protein